MDAIALYNAITSRGFKINQIANDLGISRTAFYRKSHGIVEFTVSEMNRLSRILQLSEEEKRAIFF
jgi:ACT domain-containing protein